MSLIQEFKNFINRGNVVDLAVGIVIGSAFTKIVNSLVNDMLMPPIGYLIGGVSFADLKFNLGDLHPNSPQVTINYGMFIETCVQFVIVAFAVFMVVKGFNRMRTKEEAAPAAPPAPSNEEKLLTEIRDLLKK
jgi:large conductance mechanosensitive channel